MSKGVKRGLIAAAIVLAVVLVLMILIPFMFKGKIKEAVVKAANENLNAEVIVEDFGLNLFSNFPNATLSLNNAAIVGIDEFKSDTLLKAKSASVTINLTSLFGDNFSIGKISLDETSVYAKIAESGKANWDIMKGDSTEVATTKIDESATAFNLELKNIIIKNCNIVYEDFESNIKAYIYGWNGNINGDFSASETTLKTKSVIDQLTIMMDGIPYLSKVRATADASINANFDQMKFTFAESNFLLNDLAASIDGSFAFVDEDGYDFDMKLNAPKADFKQILSLVPAMYTDEFKNVKTAGDVTLSAHIVGLMKGEVYPAFGLQLTVSNAMFQYPTLPKSVDDINLILNVNGEGGSLDNVMVLLDRFSFALGGNPFKGSFRMMPAVNDRSIKFNAEGKLNLGMIKEVYPLESGIELNGNLDANIRVATTMSAIEKELYEKISAEGHIRLANMMYKSPDLPDVKINTAELEFTPRYVNLKAFDVIVGKSDIKADGRLENFIAYALKDQTLRGTLNVQSKLLNLDELMGDEEAATTTGAEESTESAIVPKNIDFTLAANATHVIFNKIDISNFSGGISVKDGIVSLNKIAASALGGLANINGSYNTSDPKNPKLDFDMALTRVSFGETFKSVDAIQKFAPIFEDMLGTYSMSLKFNTKLGATSAETLGALNGSGILQTSDVKIENNKALSALGTALKTDKLSKITPKDINLPFSIEDGALRTKPFNLSFGEGGEMTLEGVTKLDQTIDYKGTIKLPKSMDNKFVDKVPITIGGTFASPKIGVDVKSAITDVVGSAVEKLLGGKKDGEEGDSPGLAAKVAESKAKRIEKIRTDTDNAATKLVEAAKKESEKLVEKAGSNKLAAAGAKIAAEKLVKEAEKQAQKMRDGAEEQIKKIEGEVEAETEVEAAE